MSSVPVRLDINDPDYDPETGRDLIVTLNGALQHRVLAYDMVKGCLTRYCVDEQGNIIVESGADKAKTETVYGAVVVTRSQ